MKIESVTGRQTEILDIYYISKIWNNLDELLIFEAWIYYISNNLDELFHSRVYLRIFSAQSSLDDDSSPLRSKGDFHHLDCGNSDDICLCLIFLEYRFE